MIVTLRESRVNSAILTYHSLDDSGSVVSVSPEVFVSQMEWLSARGAPVVPLAEVCRTPGAVALTFETHFQMNIRQRDRQQILYLEPAPLDIGDQYPYT